MSVTVGSCFSGIGGIDWGLQRAGMTIRWQVEIDDWCGRVLAKHWPGVTRYGDIRELTGHELETVDVIAAGFPCQPVSVAGKRLGQDDARWLWPDLMRLIREVRPRIVLLENVTGLLSRGFGDVLGDLAACGYDAEWDCIPAAAIGAPHQRDRVFLVAYASGVFSNFGPVIHGSNDLHRNEQWRAAQGVRSGRGWKRWLVSADSHLDGYGTNGVLRGVDDGLPAELDTDRIKGLGNAVVPQVVEHIGRRIVTALEAS